MTECDYVLSSTLAWRGFLHPSCVVLLVKLLHYQININEKSKFKSLHRL